MRQIKFRGKRLDNGEWIVGDLLQSNEGSVYIGIHGQYVDDGYHFNDMYDRTLYVDEETIGQFTDILDKNGKEIWEGDIVHFVNPGLGYDLISPVIFEHGDFCMMKNKNYLIPMGNFSDVVFEVIGNIHDNPEMLKGGEEK